mmetsp:Transcript_125619/g.355344  ORF Transcript_125619/g.355344 Transcript_125619/m.355344 type:complete len:202 (+) Transcript_125619:554-1159(+)
MRPFCPLPLLRQQRHVREPSGTGVGPGAAPANGGAVRLPHRQVPDHSGRGRVPEGGRRPPRGHRRPRHVAGIPLPHDEGLRAPGPEVGGRVPHRRGVLEPVLRERVPVLAAAAREDRAGAVRDGPGLGVPERVGHGRHALQRQVGAKSGKPRARAATVCRQQPFLQPLSVPRHAAGRRRFTWRSAACCGRRQPICACVQQL